MMPRIEACYFNAARDEIMFAHMARVLMHTAGLYCPDWRCTMTEIERPRYSAPTGVAAHADNTEKSKHWVSVVQTAADGEQILLIDADTVILRGLDDVWQFDFDLAYTTKQHAFPFNLGVIFARVSEPIRVFFARWQFENDGLLQDPMRSRIWRRQYGGINQAAFGRLLEHGALDGLRVQTLPCAEWNCEESAWDQFDPAVTRILHLKSALRRAIFGRQMITRALRPAVERWRELDASLTPTRRTA